MTAEKPISFSAPMVHALFAGRKTQTRRLAKPRRRGSLLAMKESGLPEWEDSFVTDPGNRDQLLGEAAARPGEVFWVKENFRLTLEDDFDGVKPGAFRPGAPIHYEADVPPAHARFGRLRPSIHMPRSAARLRLRVTDVRLERLTACSEADAQAEGVFPAVQHKRLYGEDQIAVYPAAWLPLESLRETFYTSALGAYRALWVWIHGPGSWEANPRVWVYSFERMDG